MMDGEKTTALPGIVPDKLMFDDTSLSISRSRSFSGPLFRKIKKPSEPQIAHSEQFPAHVNCSKLALGLLTRPGSFNSLATIGVEHQDIEDIEWRQNVPRRGSITLLGLSQATLGLGTDNAPLPDNTFHNAHFVIGDVVQEKEEPTDETSRPLVASTEHYCAPVGPVIAPTTSNMAGVVRSHFVERQTYHPDFSLEKWRERLINAVHSSHSCNSPSSQVVRQQISQNLSGMELKPHSTNLNSNQEITISNQSSLMIHSVSPTRNPVQLSSLATKSEKAPKMNMTSSVLTTENQLTRNSNKRGLEATAEKRQKYRELTMSMPTGW